MDFKKNTKPKNPEKKKRDTPEILNIVLKIEKRFLMLFKVKYFNYHPLRVQDVLQTLFSVSNIKS